MQENNSIKKDRVGDWTSVDQKLKNLMSKLHRQGVGVPKGVNKENFAAAPAPPLHCQCEALISEQSKIYELQRQVEGSSVMGSALGEQQVGECKDGLEKALSKATIGLPTIVEKKRPSQTQQQNRTSARPY